MFVITDSNLTWDGQGEVFSIPAGEQSKTLATVEMIYNRLYELGYTRDATIVGFGGGVVLDIAGFVAATYCRGVKFISIPTTLLAMVDACVGGKNGVNFRDMKNGIGTFYEPDEVRIDPTYLLTLPDREYRAGMAECIKCAIIRDSDFFTFLEEHIALWKERDLDFLQSVIDRSLAIKREIVALDREDRGVRHLLNFGHTVGHAIEALSNYTIPHGEAVAIGLSVESRDRSVDRLLELYGFQIDLPFSTEAIEEAMKRDKKMGRNPLFQSVGTCTLA